MTFDSSASTKTAIADSSISFSNKKRQKEKNAFNHKLTLRSKEVRDELTISVSDNEINPESQMSLAEQKVTNAHIQE